MRPGREYDARLAALEPRVRREAERLPLTSGAIDVDDLVQVALIEAWLAMEAGVKHPRVATLRLRMIDELRRDNRQSRGASYLEDIDSGRWLF